VAKRRRCLSLRSRRLGRSGPARIFLSRECGAAGARVQIMDTSVPGTPQDGEGRRAFPARPTARNCSDGVWAEWRHEAMPMLPLYPMKSFSSAAYPRRRAFTLIELLTVIAIIGILAAIIIPTVGKVRATAQNAKCASNLRQLAMGANLYASDNKGLLQPGLCNWKEVLKPYISTLNNWTINVGVGNCPAQIETSDPAAQSYAWNGVIDDKEYKDSQWKRKVSAPPVPSRVILVGEMIESQNVCLSPSNGGLSWGAKVSSRHGAKANFAFADSSVRSIDPKLTEGTALPGSEGNLWQWW
jgi:prepilin-type N-terminal cleavage/methylation domain-containing protein/prepilin-type processing-associated H-X9-DG protein